MEKKNYNKENFIENNEKNKKNKIIKYNDEYINNHEKSINKDIIDNQISNIEDNIFKKKEKNNIKDSYEDIYKDYKVIIRKKRYINESVFGIKHIKEEIDKIIEMPSFDILNYNKENENRKEEFNKLRKEYLDLKNKKNNENNNLFLIKPKRRNSRFIKNFDSSRLTFDSNGKIIQLQIPKLSQVSSEFNSPKQKIINNINNFSLKNKNSKRFSLSLKNPTIISFEKNKYNLKDTVKDISNNNEKISKIENIINNNDVNNKLIITSNQYNNNKNNEIIEYNPIDYKSNFYHKYSIPSKQLIIGGPNFEKIIPEVGVIIHNDNIKNQTKFGGFKYTSKYNRPSIIELSKESDKTRRIKSLNDLSLSFNSENNELSNINYNGYKKEFDDNNNPLLQNAQFLNNRNKFIPYFSNNNNGIKKKNKYKKFDIDLDDLTNKNHFKRKIRSSFTNISSSKIISQNSIDSIKLSGNKEINDIYNVLIDDKNTKIKKSNINNNSLNKSNDIKNIMSIKELISIKKGFPVINELNKRNEFIKGRKIISKFNYDIIQNKNWGNNYIIEKENNGRYFINNIFRKEKYRKLKINEENNINNINNNNQFLRDRNLKTKRIFSSSSVGNIFSQDNNIISVKKKNF